MQFVKQVKPKNLKVLTSFLSFSGPVDSQLPPMSMHFKHDSSSLIASIWKSGTCFSCPFFDILTKSLPKEINCISMVNKKFENFLKCNNQCKKAFYSFFLMFANSSKIDFITIAFTSPHDKK
jgi:hypothetical protein